MAKKEDHQELALLGRSTPVHDKPIEETNDTSKDAADDHEYPGLWSLMAIMTALYLAIFLVALDRTIIATAIPRITDDFHSLDDIAWYGSAYLLTSCSFQLLYGRIFTFYSPKWVFLCAIVLFEIGSAICGAAPTSTAFIIGRAIAGLGSCGIFSGCIVIITDAVPLQKRPMLTGLMGSLFGIASVVAPIMGGAFTDNVTWRWCFYINLPIGGFTILVILFILKASPPPNPSQANTLSERLHQLDPFGTAAFLPGMICLLLALTWGGVTYPWSNGRIIALFILSGVLLIAFVLIQVWKGETASVPPRLVKKRTMSAGFFFTFCLGGTMLLIVYYLPVWFQAIKGANAVKSGIMNIPLVLSLVVGSIIAGAAVTNLGYFTPFMVAGSVVMAIGAGLLTTFTTNTGHSKWIGYQVILGLGIGLGMQQGSVAAQTILERKDVPTGASIMMLSQSLGGSIFVAVGQTVFSNGLSSNLRSNLQGPDASNIITSVIQAGATGFRRLPGLTAEDLSAILSAYNKAIVNTFYVCVGLASVSIVGALATEWVSVKKQGGNKQHVEKKGEEAA